MGMYWANALVQEGEYNSVRRWSSTESYFSLPEATKIGHKFAKQNAGCLSMWVDKIEKNGRTTCVYYECYIDSLGFRHYKELDAND